MDIQTISEVLTMKRLLPLLLCAALLTGCGGARETTDEIKTADPIETTTPIEIVETAPAYPAGDTVDYRWGDAVSINLTLPQGWAWEEAPQNESVPPTAAGVVFYPEARAGDCAVSFQCWLQGFGMCGTGVTFSEVVSQANGEEATLATEDSGDHIMVTIIRKNVPGDYVATAYLPADFWQENRDTILECVLTAEVGADCMSLDEARALAATAWPDDARGEDVTVYGRYDVLTQVWTLTAHRVTKAAQDGGETLSPLYRLTVDDDGTVGEVTPVSWNG